MPNEFTRGCERAIPVFFNTLQDISANVKQKLKAKSALENTETDSNDHSKTTKDSDAATVKPLKIITAALHDDLEQFIHDLYQNHGLEFKINLISVNNVKHVENHLAFGQSLYTTLSIAPITVELAPMVYKRKYRTGYLFKEMNFEYYIPESDATDESTPTLNDRLEMTRQNVVVAIVVEANLDFNFSLEKDGESMYSEQITKNVLFRFETEPFVGREVGQFKIADVDNYFASALIPSLKD